MREWYPRSPSSLQPPVPSRPACPIPSLINSCFTRRLCDAERDQIHLWECLLRATLHGCAYLFEVVDCCCFDEPVQLQHYSSRCVRGLVATLEVGQAPRLLELLDGLPQGTPEWMLDSQGEAVATIVRLPAPYCRLLLAGTWRSFVLPRGGLVGGRRGGASAIHFNWEMLDIAGGQVPVPPRLFGPNAGDVSDLNTDVLHELCDVLRECSTLCDLTTEPGQRKHASLERLVRTFEGLATQSDTFALQQTAREMDHRAHARPAGKSTPYRVGWLVKAMLMSDLLRNSQDMLEALEVSLNLVLPPVLWPLLRDMLQETISVVPSKSTISRWRVLLDGALMLHARREHLTQLENGGMGAVRYLMIDSSNQHNRDYEHMIVRMLPRSALCDLFEDSNDLIELWRLSSTIDDEDTLDMDATLMQRHSLLSCERSLRHMPIVVLGSGRTSLADKLCALVHCCFLESGSSLQSLKEFLNSISCCTTDFGVEFVLQSVCLVSVKMLP